VVNDTSGSLVQPTVAAVRSPSDLQPSMHLGTSSRAEQQGVNLLCTKECMHALVSTSTAGHRTTPLPS
jgi:hypothetical protein